MTKQRTVFVFGSNLAGRHGKGAALYAVQNHNAVYGCGEGMQGDSYAIPTKDSALRTLSLDTIREHVAAFVAFAKARGDMSFVVTRIGCGLAGYTDTAIAPMFENAPSNCLLPDGWRLHQAFRVLVCGGRNYNDAARVFAVLDHYHAQRPFSLVVHGAAKGADTLADEWARARGVNVARYPAAWETHGHRAGSLRNTNMLVKEFPEIVIAFPGGKGTRNMKKQATEAGVPVLEIPA